MRSTEDEKTPAAVEELFDRVIAPMAERLRSNGAAPFPLQPDASAATYYVKRPRPAMTREDFTNASCADFDDFERRLRAHWMALGRHELAAHAKSFGAAARAVYALGDQDAEVSPFVYVMF